MAEWGQVEGYFHPDEIYVFTGGPLVAFDPRDSGPAAVTFSTNSIISSTWEDGSVVDPDSLQGAIEDCLAGFRPLPEPATPPLVMSRDTVRHAEPFPEQAMTHGWRRG